MQIESIIFGGTSGFGESILIKFSEEKYGIIDSFLNSKTKQPYVLDYLSANSINPDFVDFILLTHYHQDHFSGLANILKKCTKARFFCPNVVALKSFQFLSIAHSRINSKHSFFKEILEVFRLLKVTDRKILAISDKSAPLINTDDIKIYALSPNKDTKLYFDEIYKERAKRYLENPNVKLSIGEKFNFQSIVLVVEIRNKISILYGGDLEYHSTNNKIGWHPICISPRFKTLKVKLFKIPHHGSNNGYNENDWKSFLMKDCILKMTPYSRGRGPLPTREMVNNIVSISSSSFITSKCKFKKFPHSIRKKVKHLDIKRIKNGVGNVHVSIDEKNINVIIDGEARSLLSFLS